MKAEHRKELQTNYLADRMGRLMQGMKSGPQSTGSMVAWVLVALTIGIVVVWYVASAHSNRSDMWVRFEEDSDQRDLPGLENLMNNHPATIPARASRIQLARFFLEEGLANLYSGRSDDAEKAVKRVTRSRDLYEQLVKECSDDPILAPQALMGAAKAEEALAGIPKGDNADEGEGSLNKALGYYRKIVEKYPKSFLASSAQAHIDSLHSEKNRAQAEKFYQEMRKLVAEAPKK
jgi:tetratricopeptide (TPR) repeat protein